MQRAVRKNLAENDLRISEEEVQTLWGAVMAGRDALEIDRTMAVLREAVIHLQARRVEFQNADKSLQEVESDFETLYEIIRAREPRRTTQSDDLYSSSSSSGASYEDIGVVDVLAAVEGGVGA
jgi:hypothetical protein